ncbi:MAG: YggT family protein [Pseudomonadota bacterium]
MTSFLQIFNLLVSVVFWIVIIQAILSWLIVFNVINLNQPLVRQISNGLNALTEPVYRPIRNKLPQTSGIDLAPLVVLLGLFIVQTIINNNLGPAY